MGPLGSQQEGRGIVSAQITVPGTSCHPSVRYEDLAARQYKAMLGWHDPRIQAKAGASPGESRTE